MRNILIIFIISLMLFWSCTSCNESKPQADIDTQDNDTAEISDIDSVVDEAPDPDYADVEIQDSDADVDISVECLDLKIQENVINTPFPFTDKDGKPTFCRPGCDTPTETDPQCVRNIWEWRNWENQQKYLEKEAEDSDQTYIRSCYPWPCVLPDMKADSTLETFNSKCDRWLTVNGFSASMGTVWSHGMSNGVAGMDMGSYLNLLAIEYDPETDEYLALGALGGSFSFNENRYVYYVLETRPDDNPNYRSYGISIEKKDGKYYYELIHDNENHNSYFSRPSFAGEKWVLIQVREGKNGSNTEVKYAKAGVWNWQKIDGIGSPLAQEGNIVGDHLTFITNDREMYFCDLTKTPKHINDCKLINRKTGTDNTLEEGHSPKIDTENEKRVIYNINLKHVFVEVDFTDIENPNYTEYEIPKNKDTAYGLQVETVRGNKALYAESFTDGGASDHIGCFFRFDKKKIYCPQENIFSVSAENSMGYNTFWGKWHLWKYISSPTAIMRDWECYCTETGVCPLEE